MSILDQLTEHALLRVDEAKKVISSDEIKRRALELPGKNHEFARALKKSDISFICECKKASPSKGLIAKEFDATAIAKEYEAAGADCISVLTEPKWFLGSNEYLLGVTENVNIPCIRKDFTVDEYMIYEARVLGASAVLLICSVLSDSRLEEYLGICRELGMDALVEAHDGEEVMRALKAGAEIIGVNNRNLRDFSVDAGNAIGLRKMIPEGKIFVSESGISTADDIRALRDAGVDAVLVGEALMRAPDKKKKLQELKGRDV
ncbi:MAG: indole-3-glycerol phosphate synthase TrpC [Butyrivibrio sp.]|nr:indole-3-glycerol phosphate synthase TrpC [Butyrivibrio sp.]